METKEKKALDVLINCRETVADLLHDSPFLNIRVSHVMDELIRSYEHSTSLYGEKKAEEETEPLPSILGIKFEKEKKGPLQVVRPAAELEEEFINSVNRLYDGFLSSNPKDIVISPDRELILGVATKAGVPYDADVQITVDFVKRIQQKIKNNKAIEKKKEEKKENDKL